MQAGLSMRKTFDNNVKINSQQLNLSYAHVIFWLHFVACLAATVSFPVWYIVALALVLEAIAFAFVVHVHMCGVHGVADYVANRWSFLHDYRCGGLVGDGGLRGCSTAWRMW